MNHQRLAFIFIHYHTPQLLSHAIDALTSQLDTLPHKAEIIVVDNGSHPQDAPLLASLPAKVITASHNLGYGAGIALGIENTDADIFFFMNPDIIVLDDCISQLLTAFDDGAEVIAPMQFWDIAQTVTLPVLEKRSRLDYLLANLSTRSHVVARLTRRWQRNHQLHHWNATQPIRSYALAGGCLAMPREIWQKVGIFDDKYWLYFEETEWLERAKAMNIDARLVPQAHVCHLFNQSARQLTGGSHPYQTSFDIFVTQMYGNWFPKSVKTITNYLSLVDDNFEQLDEFAISVKAFKKPLLIEIALSLAGFPAAGVRVIDDRDVWHLSSEILQYATDGTYYLRVVDGNGQEHSIGKVIIS